MTGYLVLNSPKVYGADRFAALRIAFVHVSPICTRVKHDQDFECRRPIERI